MKRISIILFALFIVSSCQEEVIEPNTPIEPSCQCYEVHEQLYVTLGWKFAFNSATFEDFCSKDNGVYSYLDNNTKRYKYICQ